jgi:hypothetical protein
VSSLDRVSLSEINRLVVECFVTDEVHWSVLSFGALA